MHDQKTVQVSEWVIKFSSLSGDSGQQGSYSPYKQCNHSLYIGNNSPTFATYSIYGITPGLGLKIAWTDAKW